MLNKLFNSNYSIVIVFSYSFVDCKYVKIWFIISITLNQLYMLDICNCLVRGLIHISKIINIKNRIIKFIYYNVYIFFWI